MTRLAALSIVVALALALVLAGAPARADENLQEAQQTLQLMGLFAGRADGKPSDNTTRALQAFQRQNGLPVTGKLDAKSLEVLRQKQGQFQGTFGAAPERQPGGRARDSGPESKPQAAPTVPVEAAPLTAPPGARPSPSPPSSLPSTQASVGSTLPPALFSNNPSQPSTAGLGGQSTFPRAGGAVAGEPARGWRDWLWVLPFAGLPIFAGIWWYAVRRPPSPFAGMERPQRRREPRL